MSHCSSGSLSVLTSISRRSIGTSVSVSKQFIGFSAPSTFAATTLLGWQPVLSARHDRRLRPAVGAISGVIGGMSSFFAPTVTPYLFSLGLDRNTFIRAMGVAFLIGEFPLMLGLIAAGFAPLPVWVLSAAGWALVAAAMHLGAKLRDRVPQKGFKTIVGVTLLVVGLNMIRRALF